VAYNSVTTETAVFLGAFAKLREANIASSCLSVRMG